MPRGWLIPRRTSTAGRYAAAIERLRMHGLHRAARRRAGADRCRALRHRRLTKAEQPFQGHHEARLTGKYLIAKLSAQEGALFIPAAQPLARLAFYLLEPESDDGLVTWNLIEGRPAAGGDLPDLSRRESGRS